MNGRSPWTKRARLLGGTGKMVMWWGNKTNWHIKVLIIGGHLLLLRFRERRINALYSYIDV